MLKEKEFQESLEVEYQDALNDIHEWEVFNNSRNLLERNREQIISNQFQKMVSCFPMNIKWWLVKKFNPCLIDTQFKRMVVRYMKATGWLSSQIFLDV